MDHLLAGEPAICDMVRMEVLTGGRDEHHVQQLRRLLARASNISLEPVDYEAAAALYRACRRQGATVRKLVDCLIAPAAIRADIPLLHPDADFDVLAQRSRLRIEPLD